MKIFKFIFFFFVGVFGAIVLSETFNADFFKWDGAKAQTGNMVSCYEVSLVSGKAETDPVLVQGIANSGTYQFSEPIDYGACVLKEKKEDLLVQGWTWNTNLGWTGFLCSGGFNSGIDCGSTPYSVTLNPSKGELGGYAWGDNIGWISMKCSGGKNGTADCGNIDYGVRVALANNTNTANGADKSCGVVNKGDLYGYAWTDTVGWMNFCGAHVDLDALTEPEPDQTPPADGTTPPADGTTPDTGTTTTPDTGAPTIEYGQQATLVKGQVNIGIVNTKGMDITDFISAPVGEQPQSHREFFYRSINKNIETQKPDSFDFSGNNTKTIDEKFLTPLDKSKSYYFKRDKNTNEPCKIIFDDTDDMLYGESFPKKNFITIVSQGCDVYIDKNLRSKSRDKDTDYPQSRLGIVVLEDLAMKGKRRGGNVYICSRVTDVEAHLVMDGSLFSYGKDENDCGTDKSALIDSDGLPIFDSATIKNLLRHQLTIVGLVFGNNTYGGSFLNPPVLGDGTVLADNSTENIAKARLYDLNFLRYANVEENTVDPEQLCWEEGVQLSKYLIPLDVPLKYKNQKAPYPTGMWKKLCEYNFPKDDRSGPSGITNIIYNPTTEEMPIFGHPETKKE